MFAVYYITVTTIGTIVTDFMNDTLFGEWIQPTVGGWLTAAGAADWLNGLIVDGIIGGVGAVLGFVPQMLILFFFLAILEGLRLYGARGVHYGPHFPQVWPFGKELYPDADFLRLRRAGVMATKTIETEKDRRMTIMTHHLYPCSAKLPIIALMFGSMFGTEQAGWVAPLFYFLGVAAVIVSGIILKRLRCLRATLPRS